MPLMEYRQLGKSGLRVSVLSLGTMTFGGRSVFSKVGSTDVDTARRQIDLCLEAGVNLFDTADVYSEGVSEEILGQVLEGAAITCLLQQKPG
jgi:aryl-alcohol dehydrogenase-like predicted oxidoreductase